MRDDFFRFPHTPHIAWLGDSEPRDDKLLSPGLKKEILAGPLIVEEKVDGANVGFSLDQNGMLRAQNRGAWIERDAGGQFKSLWRWLQRFEYDLVDILSDNLILFGEWCYAQHSLPYRNLPDLFIGFDVYDRLEQSFYSVKRRNDLLELLELPVIRTLASGHFSMEELHEFLDKPSGYGAEKIEGIYLRSDSDCWLKQRAKLVRSDFTQAIDMHWSKKGLIRNGVKGLF